MKKSDIISTVLIGIVGFIIAYFSVNAILGDPDKKTVSFKTMDVVSASLDEPDPEVFNRNALNPTVEVYVGNCEDVDRNGIIDEAERSTCKNPEG